MQDILTFIMAGGKGERLYPLTKDRAKPAVPFGGIYRIIDFTLNNCINSGLRRIYILTQYKSTSLQRHISLGWNIFTREIGEYIEVIPAQQRVGEMWYQGTADAVYQNLYAVKQENPEDVLILSGDHVYKMDYREMIDYHRYMDADVTLAAVPMPKKLSDQFGVIEVGKGNRVIGFHEKPKEPIVMPDDPESILVNMGIYVFRRNVLIEELESDAKKKESQHDFGKNILPAMLKKKRKMFVFHFRDKNGKKPKYWRDIGTIQAYYEANMDLVKVTPEFNLYDRDWPIRTYQVQSPPAKTVFAGGDTGDRIGLVLDSLISNGCIVSGGKVVRSILSPGVRVNSYALVEDSILMDGVNIGRYCRIRRAIIDKGVHIPPGTQIGYNLEEDKKKFYVHPSGIVVIPKGTRLT